MRLSDKIWPNNTSVGVRGFLGGGGDSTPV